MEMRALPQMATRHRTTTKWIWYGQQATFFFYWSMSLLLLLVYRCVVVVGGGGRGGRGRGDVFGGGVAGLLLTEN